MDYCYLMPAQQHYPHTSANSGGYGNSPSDYFNNYQSYNYNQYACSPLTPEHKPSITPTNGLDILYMSLEDTQQRNNVEKTTSTRKTQNRASQRAFRERRERHVKDLEDKVATAEMKLSLISKENENLKLQLLKTTAENAILRAADPWECPDVAPLQYKHIDFYSHLSQTDKNKTPSHRTMSKNGEKLLAAGAIWDYIIKHPLYIKGYVDIGHVSERLGGAAKRHGQLLVCEERAILEAFEEGVSTESDELL